MPPKVFAACGLFLAAASGVPFASSAPLPVVYADVLVGAGHEGRPQSCQRFPQHKCNLGTAGERKLTAEVADEATRILRAAGVAVVRLPADFAGSYAVKDAVFIHFDGDVTPCGSGASIGYHRASDTAAADTWRTLYGKYWTFRFHPDNFTDNLRNYYAFRQVHASDAALVLELGELTCPPQKAWLERRIKWEGALIAHFLSLRSGEGNIPEPSMLR